MGGGNKQQPHESAKVFFQQLMQNNCHICWSLFSEKTQKEFIQWTLRDLYTHHAEAAKAAGLGNAEVKLMFETNNLDLIINFWRRFVRHSSAQDFFRYGYFTTLEVAGKTATVEAKLVYPDGTTRLINLTMVSERSGWRLGYLESGLGW